MIKLRGILLLVKYYKLSPLFPVVHTVIYVYYLAQHKFHKDPYSYSYWTTNLCMLEEPLYNRCQELPYNI